MVTALRSLLDFLHVQGLLANSLASAVPTVAGSRLAGLPKGLAAGQVQQLLTSCDRRTAVGRRDFAVLSLLVRLGLRAGEVVALELGILTGVRARSSCAAKAIVKNACRCPSIEGWLWWTTCKLGVPVATAGRSSYVCAHHIAR
jgi:integrase/recombinase XerD